MSPTVCIVDGYRFFFFSKEGNEKAHIHIKREEFVCKFWLKPKIKLASNDGFKLHELKRIEALVIENEKVFLERWHEFFKS